MEAVLFKFHIYFSIYFKRPTVLDLLHFCHFLVLKYLSIYAFFSCYFCSEINISVPLDFHLGHIIKTIKCPQWNYKCWDLKYVHLNLQKRIKLRMVVSFCSIWCCKVPDVLMWPLYICDFSTQKTVRGQINERMLHTLKLVKGKLASQMVDKICIFTEVP